MQSDIVYKNTTRGFFSVQTGLNHMTKFVFLLPGIIFGVAEFFLLKTIASRATNGRNFLIALIVKFLSYVAILVPVLMFRNTTYTIYFGIGAGAGLLVVGLAWFIRYSLKKEER